MSTILITGCSSGFGRQAAAQLVERGHTVVAAIRGGQSRLETVFAAELKRYPERLIAVDLHMEKPETFAVAGRLVDERLGGKLDALVNNAGYGLFGAIEDVGEEQLRHQMEVNFFGPALLTRALLPALRAARGRVINVSSVCGRHGFPFYAPYTASKFALEGLMESMYFDLRPFGVQVSLIEPGGFRTDFATRSRMFGQGSLAPSSAYRERGEAFSHFLATSGRRLGDPARVARLIVRSVERRRLPLRRPIGADSWLMALLGWLLPQGVRLRLLDVVFRLAVFGR
jgi:NAD(P)-dependent dehydrogenase (short-subunit alcohol dehydrogenase family)